MNSNLILTIHITTVYKDSLEVIYVLQFAVGLSKVKLGEKMSYRNIPQKNEKNRTRKAIWYKIGKPFDTK